MHTAVFDSSALIFSIKIREVFDLIRKKYPALLIPPAVFREVVQAGKERGAPEARTIEELLAQNVLALSPPTAPIAPDALDAGEAEALALAKKHGIPCISDDRKAYLVGNTHGITVFSLSAFLVHATKTRRVSARESEELLSRLVEAGYYLKTADYLLILKALRES